MVAAEASCGDVESMLGVVGSIVPGGVRLGVVVDFARRDGEREVITRKRKETGNWHVDATESRPRWPRWPQRGA